MERSGKTKEDRKIISRLKETKDTTNKCDTDSIWDPE